MTDDKATEKASGLALMREKFPANLISKLPKPTRAQTDEVKQNFKAGVRCQVCGGWHHPKVIHLDYVGHAALTDRLLDCDPEWNWEPLSVDDRGLPVLDSDGGLWIRLTVSGMTRLGYGDAQGKTGGDAMKERIGDALRNAAMRFGAALDLWHKGDLHADEAPANPAEAPAEAPEKPEFISAEQKLIITNELAKAKYPLEGFLKKADVKSLDEIKESRFKGCLTHIQTVAQTAGD